jgi:hypothetical protein
VDAANDQHREQAGDSFLVAFQREHFLTPHVWGEGVMADSKLLRAATLNRIGDLVDDTEGVNLREPASGGAASESVGLAPAS